MSKKTQPNDPSALIDFLQLVATRNNWKRFLSNDNHKPETVVVLGEGEIFYEPEGIATVDKTTSVRFILSFSLTPHEKVQGLYLLYKFEITTLEIKGKTRFGTIPGSMALRHFAKRFAKGDDIRNPLTGDLWEIRRPADIEALFRAYDNVARLNEAITIFNLP